MVCPSTSCIFSAKARPMVSVALPAAKGTTALMGRSGQAWAKAVYDNASTATVAAINRTTGFIGVSFWWVVKTGSVSSLSKRQVQHGRAQGIEHHEMHGAQVRQGVALHGAMHHARKVRLHPLGGE